MSYPQYQEDMFQKAISLLRSLIYPEHIDKDELLERINEEL